jgi:hypothetical protein
MMGVMGLKDWLGGWEDFGYRLRLGGAWITGHVLVLGKKLSILIDIDRGSVGSITEAV